MKIMILATIMSTAMSIGNLEVAKCHAQITATQAVQMMGTKLENKGFNPNLEEVVSEYISDYEML